MINDPNEYKRACQHALDNGKISATLYRHGAIVTGWPSRWPAHPNTSQPKRGKIVDQSVRSMIRAGFEIANSPANFDLMTTLTFREVHLEPKECLRKWCLKMRLNEGEKHPWGWVMEFQKRGIVHFHVLHTLAHLEETALGGPFTWQPVKRAGKTRNVLAGVQGRLAAMLWVNTVGDTSEAFRRFQLGGITERVEHPELTALYLGRYVSKSAQKQLPADHPPAGRWWWLSRAARPIPGKTIPVFDWPWDKPHRLVYDQAKLIELSGGHR